jgi:hypothetical protein
LVLNTLTSLKNDIVTANIAGGIFIAITFIIEVYKKLPEKAFRLLILTDDKTFEIPSQDLPAIEGLIKKVKDMPFFIDIIRIGTKNPEERNKLMRLARICNGELYEINHIQDITPILTEFAYKKRIDDYFFKLQKERVVLKNNQPFYTNLADEPIEINEISTCSICFQRDNIGFVKCPSCETITHKICWAHWAQSSTIGIPHVFRCHSCFNILKLDEDFVKDVQAGKITSILDINKIEQRNIVEHLREIEAKSKPELIQAEDPFAAEVRALIESKKEKLESVNEKRKIKRRGLVKICPHCRKLIRMRRRHVVLKCPSCGQAI